MEKNTGMHNMHSMSYGKFLLTMAVSFLIMYGIMFINVDDSDHIYLSITRTYMALLMVLAMAPVMMGFMGKMYPNKKLNKIIVIASVLGFFGIVFLLRKQVFVGDNQYMKAMIPHHSSAIMTSKNADIKDPKVKRLSEQIIKSQEEEIAQMKAILKRMSQ